MNGVQYRLLIRALLEVLPMLPVCRDVTQGTVTGSPFCHFACWVSRTVHAGDRCIADLANRRTAQVSVIAVPLDVLKDLNANPV